MKQAHLRSNIRIVDGRAKPIDLLAKYISAEEGKFRKYVVSIALFDITSNIISFVLKAQRLDWTSMSVLKCTSSPRMNLFVTYVKDRLLAKHKNTVTEL